jgi:hypothetical protein
MGVAHRTVKEALEFVAKHPEPSRPPIEMPIWELISRQLFEASHKVGGNALAMKRATAAQKMIFDRLAGKRRPGTHPATVKTKRELKVLDLTQFQGEATSDE